LGWWGCWPVSIGPGVYDVGAVSLAVVSFRLFPPQRILSSGWVAGGTL